MLIMSTFSANFVRLLLQILIVISSQLSASFAFAQNSVSAGTIDIEIPTLHSVGFVWNISGDENRNATVGLEYRIKGDSAWSQGLAFLRTENHYYPASNVTPGNKLAGSALFLNPNTTYEFRLTLRDVDGGFAQRVVEATTRGVPSASPSGRTLYISPGNGGGTGSATNPFLGFAAADAAARPGDLFL